ncbi:MAG: OmpH family outer membrane protein [Lewinellaceae bacterium]|nr:OmpH family outer membrane protein [Saprospiraceae bacterium]MCB0543213.1 OmpH family outer membrane protein [Saprospiraceae bacterium]MCB9305767.1 OmpH family outer membrane protein [Lewinellaceae bacterium]MCB9353113.1 OmpH family outer membrane protein [Lewinellaceae bacterium]
MKNLPIILNIILFALVGHLYYLNLKKPQAAEPKVIAPPPSSAGIKIAYVNGDTLDAKYEWLKQQKEAIQQRIRNAENNLAAKQEALMRDANALQEKFQTGTMSQADAEKQQAALMQRGQRLQEEEERLRKSLGEEQKKAFNDLYANVEEKLKTLSGQIGYDYILSYSRGGQILLANDSLDITNEVLDLLNTREENKK